MKERETEGERARQRGRESERARERERDAQTHGCIALGRAAELCGSVGARHYRR